MKPLTPAFDRFIPAVAAGLLLLGCGQAQTTDHTGQTSQQLTAGEPDLARATGPASKTSAQLIAELQPIEPPDPDPTKTIGLESEPPDDPDGITSLTSAPPARGRAPHIRHRAAIAVAPDGHYLLAGAFQGRAVGVELPDGLLADSSGGWDMLLTKRNAQGQQVWAQVFASFGDEKALDVAVDTEGQIFLVGTFQDSLTFGDPTQKVAPGQPPPGLTLSTGTARGRVSAFAAKFTANGVAVWATVLGDGFAPSAQLSLSVDAESQVWVSGSYDESTELAAGVAPDAANGLFVARLDAGGVAQEVSRPFGPMESGLAFYCANHAICETGSKLNTGTVGCNGLEKACFTHVCSNLRQKGCCDSDWGADCVSFAEAQCPRIDCNCDADLCKVQAGPGDVGCDGARQVCDVDPFCCTNTWDAICVGALQLIKPELCDACE